MRTKIVNRGRPSQPGESDGFIKRQQIWDAVRAPPSRQQRHSASQECSLCAHRSSRLTPSRAPERGAWCAGGSAGVMAAPYAGDDGYTGGDGYPGGEAGYGGGGAYMTDVDAAASGQAGAQYGGMEAGPPGGQPYYDDGGQQPFYGSNNTEYVDGDTGDFDHHAAKVRLRELKREAESRRRRQAEQARRENDILREQLEAEELRMRQAQLDREAEMHAAKEEQHRRFEAERNHRLNMMKELRKKEVEQRRVERVKPLYKRREEEAEARKKKEEAARAEKLRARRAGYEPVDFRSLARRAVNDGRDPANATDGSALEQGGKSVGRSSSRSNVVPLPPVKTYYHGKARERVVAEAFEKRNKKELAREVRRPTSADPLPPPPRSPSPTPHPPPLLLSAREGVEGPREAVRQDGGRARRGRLVAIAPVARPRATQAAARTRSARAALRPAGRRARLPRGGLRRAPPRRAGRARRRRGEQAEQLQRLGGDARPDQPSGGEGV